MLFRSIPLARLVRSLTCCATLPKSPVVFTFDDGWESQLDAALPVLVRHRIPATFFVLPGFDSKQAKHMTFEDFGTLAGAGMSVQSHSLNPVNCRDWSASTGGRRRRRSSSRNRSWSRSVAWTTLRIRLERLIPRRRT